MNPIVLNLFSEEVDSLDHPAVREFREILERIAQSYGSRLAHFGVKQGAVSFQFDNLKPMHDIMVDVISTVGYRDGAEKRKSQTPAREYFEKCAHNNPAALHRRA